MKLRNRPRAWLLIGATALLVAVIAGCGSSSTGGSSSSSSSSAPAKKKSGTITLGEVIGASGWLTAFDIPPSQGARLAIKQINADGGVDGLKYKMIRTDHTSDPAKVNQATQDALSQGAQIVLATCNYEEAGPTAQIASAQQKVTFSYCGGEPLFTRQVGGANKLVFDMGNETNGVGAVMAKFATGKAWKRAYVLEDTSFDYTREMAKFFRAAYKSDGGTVVGNATFKNDDNSIAGQAGQIKGAQAKADVVILASTLPGAGTALRQLRAAGVTLPILTGDGMDSRSVAKTVPDLSNFYFVAGASIYGDDPDPKVNQFFQTLEQQTGKPADGSYAIFGYSIMQALTDALKKTGGDTSGPKLAAALQTLKNYPTLLGPLTFTATQHVDPYRPQRILTFTKGKAHYVTTVTPVNIPPAF